MQFKIQFLSWASVANACNFGYSGGRDQEDHSLKTSSGKQLKRPYLENIQYKIGMVK
jgi:hypothetical protein